MSLSAPSSAEAGWLLIVDDDQGIQEALGDLLAFEGYRAERAYNGREALEKLHDAPTLPAVILLDLMMPVMSGFEFRAAQLDDPRLADIPVVVLTAGLVTERVHKLSAAAYLRKPLDIDRLLQELDRYLATP